MTTSNSRLARHAPRYRSRVYGPSYPRHLALLGITVSLVACTRTTAGDSPVTSGVGAAPSSELVTPRIEPSIDANPPGDAKGRSDEQAREGPDGSTEGGAGGNHPKVAPKRRPRGAAGMPELTGNPYTSFELEDNDSAS